MIVIFLRTVIVFITLMIVMRLMGKRQIGEMQSFELVITLIIADLACIPMADVSIPLTYGIVSILALFILHEILSLLEKLGTFPKKVISGKPSVVINKLGVDFYELKRNDLGVDDLLESMRGAGYFSLSDVDYAIFESNGKLSALKSQEQKSSSLSVILVEDGKVNKNNLSVIQKDYRWLMSELKKNNVELKKLGVMTVDGDGKAYSQCYKEPYKIFDVDMQGVKW